VVTVAVRVGLRANLAQFSLLVGINALVGGMVGQERTVLPLLARDVFGVTSVGIMLTFIATFGVVKAITNLAAGWLADRYGRRPVLLAGWLIGIPVPLLLMWAPSWGWIVAANALLGVNQGLTWSVAVIMKIDLAGPSRRGLAMGLNEAAGYGAVAITAWATGAIAASAGLRPAPFLLGLAFAGLGTGLSAAFVRETLPHAHFEASQVPSSASDAKSFRQVFVSASWSDRALAAASRAGLVNNLTEGVAWGLFPLLFAARGLSLASVGLLTAVSPAVWGVGQLFTGALSDRLGRKWLIVGGQITQAIGLVVIAASDTVSAWFWGSALFGVGTAMAYPTLLAAVADIAHPSWRARAVGVYRLWRDLGFAVGALLAGVLADGWGLATAITAAAGLALVSAVDVALALPETSRDQTVAAERRT